jgi:hypothetical protein
MSDSTDMGAQILDMLGRHGSDLVQPHSFDFYLYFPDKAAADAASMELRAQRFEVRLEADEENWLCLATKLMPPDEDILDQLAEWLEDLAEQHGGEFDGWETAIVKS